MSFEITMENGDVFMVDKVERMEEENNLNRIYLLDKNNESVAMINSEKLVYMRRLK